ncbi:MAG TPA: TRAP transporter large permease subunit, partial [Casimicrobiaceae bacterium]
GELMERAGISERLVNLAKALVAHIQGGLGMVVIVAEYLFSGISGSTAADISAVGSLLIAPMERAGYSKGQAVAIVSAATAMGILVPPCIFMIVLASMTNQSIGAMFVAGFLPAIVIAVGLVAYVYWKAGAMGHSRSAADLLAVAATRADAGASALRQKLQPRHRTSAASSAPLSHSVIYELCRPMPCSSCDRL